MAQNLSIMGLGIMGLIPNGNQNHLSMPLLLQQHGAMDGAMLEATNGGLLEQLNSGRVLDARNWDCLGS